MCQMLFARRNDVNHFLCFLTHGVRTFSEGKNFSNFWSLKGIMLVHIFGNWKRLT